MVFARELAEVTGRTRVDPTYKRRRGEDGGQAMVEFSLTVPILIILIVSLGVFAVMLYSYVTLSHGAREGARYIIGAPYASNIEVENYVKTRLTVLDHNLVVIDIQPPSPSARNPGQNITVRVSYPFQIMDVTVPYIIAPGGFRMFPPLWISGVSTMYMD